MSEPCKKYVRFVPSHLSCIIPCKGCQFCSAEIYAGYQVSQGLTVNVKLLRIGIVSFFGFCPSKTSFILLVDTSKEEHYKVTF